jgi:hypothetical protein
MSQKSSIPQAAKSVSWVLVADKTQWRAIEISMTVVNIDRGVANRRWVSEDL